MSASPPPESTPTPAAAASSPAIPIVDVEEDPAMKEQLADQAQQGPAIAALREALSTYCAEHSEDELVKEFLVSDRTVYRFLKARKFDIEKAVLLFKSAVTMRSEKQLNGCLLKPCIKGLEYKVVSKHGWHGFDKYGRPIFIKNTGLQHFPSVFSAGTLEERVQYNTYINEYLRQVIIPHANQRIGHKYPIDQVVTIVNLKGFGFHCIKKHNYDWVKQIADINNILYPETAGSTWLINAPRIFSMVWGIVKGWIDERTRSKVMILSGDGSKEIREILGEEAFRSLPKEIGGDCECMSSDQVPQHGDGCMLGHPLSADFIAHLKKRNDEHGIPNTFSFPEDDSKLQDQEEVHDPQAEAALAQTPQ